jgi:hypothetical protein
MENVKRTEFISFLKKEFNLSQVRAVVKEVKQIDHSGNSTKLQKVLDIFIEEESQKKSRIVDDVLIGAWKNASESEKRKIVESFLKKQKTKRNDFEEISKLLKSGMNDLRPAAISGQHNRWKAVVMASILFAFVASALIGRIFPSVADKISSIGENLIMKPVYAFVYQGDILPKNHLLDKIVVRKDDLANFIRQNSQYLKITGVQNPYSVAVPVGQIIGKSAVVSQDVNGEEVKVAGWEGDASVSEKPTLRERIISAAEVIAEKQVTFSEKLNQHLQDILDR